MDVNRVCWRDIFRSGKMRRLRFTRRFHKGHVLGQSERRTKFVPNQITWRFKTTYLIIFRSSEIRKTNGSLHDIFLNVKQWHRKHNIQLLRKQENTFTSRTYFLLYSLATVSKRHGFVVYLLSTVLEIGSCQSKIELPPKVGFWLFQQSTKCDAIIQSSVRVSLELSLKLRWSPKGVFDPLKARRR